MRGSPTYFVGPLPLSPVNPDLESAARRFWAKVDWSGDCWIWTASVSGGGYGTFGLEGRSINAHRAAWLLFVGPIALDLEVCHRCDNRLCVRPDHLFLGTGSENMQDCIAKGRFVRPSDVPRGEGHYAARLTDEQVREMRLVWATGLASGPTLASHYGITKQHVYAIVKGRKRRSA